MADSGWTILKDYEDDVSCELELHPETAHSR